MKAVIQRVKSASVTVNGGAPRSIQQGLVVLFGVTGQDTAEQLPKFAEKIAHLRIFEDENGRMNKSAVELGYSLLLVSNFTLYGSTKKGKRPSFSEAAHPDVARPIYEQLLQLLQSQGLRQVQQGEFGADMQLSLVNDGPVTIVMDTADW